MPVLLEGDRVQYLDDGGKAWRALLWEYFLVGTGVSAGPSWQKRPRITIAPPS
jgi:hypothetical protein